MEGVLTVSWNGVGGDASSGGDGDGGGDTSSSGDGFGGRDAYLGSRDRRW